MHHCNITAVLVLRIQSFPNRFPAFQRSGVVTIKVDSPVSQGAHDPTWCSSRLRGRLRQMDKLERQPIFISNHPLVTLADSQRSYTSAFIFHLGISVCDILYFVDMFFDFRIFLQQMQPAVTLSCICFLDTSIFIVIREAPLAKPQTFQLLRRPGNELITALQHYNICDFNHFMHQ